MISGHSSYECSRFSTVGYHIMHTHERTVTCIQTDTHTQHSIGIEMLLNDKVFVSFVTAKATIFRHILSTYTSTGPPSRFPNVPIYMLEGEPAVGGRGTRTVPPSGNPRPPHVDRGHSPRPLPNGDIHTERERIPERGGGMGGRGQRGGGDHYSGGGGGGGRYRNRGDEDQSKKIPRLTKNRRNNGASGDSGDRGQIPPVSKSLRSL